MKQEKDIKAFELDEKKIEELTRKALDICSSAAALVMHYYNTSFQVEIKEDKTPVTDADKATEKFITKELALLTPDYPVIGEEATSDKLIDEKTYVGDIFWLLDPIDGTREFITRTGDFSISLALIKDKRPIIGIINAPFYKEVWFAYNGKSFKQNVEGKAREIKARNYLETSEPTAVLGNKCNINDLEAALASYSLKNIKRVGSAIKFAYVAEGRADFYYRSPYNGMQWDIAAGDIIVNNSGGKFRDVDGNYIEYGEYPFNTKDFFARGVGEY